MFADPTDADLLALALGALDPGRERELLYAVRASADLHARLALVIAALPPAETPTWTLPPPHLSRGFALGVAAVGGLMGDAVAPGDGVELRFGPVAEPEEKVLVVLLRSGGDWEVVSPTSETEMVRVATLPVDAEGRHVVIVHVGEAPGLERWGVATCRASTAIDWSLPVEERWRPLADAIADDPALVATVDVRVD